MKIVYRTALLGLALLLVNCGGSGNSGGSQNEAISLPLSSDVLVASDGAGNFLAVWQSGVSIVARYYDQGVGGQDIILGRGDRPRLALTPTYGHVVWSDIDSANQADIQGRVYNVATGTWRDREIAEGFNGANLLIWPDVSAFADNGMVIYQRWGGTDTSPRELLSFEFLNLTDDNFPESRWNELGDYPLDNAVNRGGSGRSPPRVASGANRRAMAAWTDSASESLHVMKFSPNSQTLSGINGTWRSYPEWTFRIFIGAQPITQRGYDVALLPNGDAFVIWLQGDRVAVNRYSESNNTWEADRQLGFAVTGSNPALAIHELGYALAIVRQANTNNVQAHHYVPNQPWSSAWQTPITINNGGQVSGDPDVAIAPDGQALAVWVEDGNVTMNRFDGTAWTGPIVIGQGIKPQVAMESNGNCLVAWEQDGFIFDYNCNLPAPRFTYSPTNPRAGDAINFDASSSTDSGGAVTGYEWDFDDDGNYDATGATATHTFTSEGTYTVRLRVTNDRGFSNTARTDITVTSNVLLSVNRIGNGTVASTAPGINCGEDCGETYRIGDSVTLTAMPGVGWSFDRWQGDCAAGNPGSQNATITFTIHNNFSGSAFLCTAEFQSGSSFELNVNVVGSGTVTSNPPGINCGSDCLENYTQGSSIVLTAAAASGFRFTGWSGDCMGDGNGPIASVRMDGNRLCYASFAVDNIVNSLAVSVTGGGNVSSDIAGIDCGNAGSDCYEEYPANTSVTLTATAASPYVFESWSGNCLSFTSNPTQAFVTVNGTVTCDAIFEVPTNAVTLTVQIVGDPGTVNEALAGFTCDRIISGTTQTTCTGSYNAGTDLLLTVNTSSGTDWLQGCDSLVTVDAPRNLYHCRLQINVDTLVSLAFR